VFTSSNEANSTVRNAIVAFLLALGFVPAHAESLFEMHRLALRNDPVYEIGQHEKEASSTVYGEARALLLPQVSLSFARSRFHQIIHSADNEVFASGTTTYPQSEWSLSLTQSIFDQAKWNTFRKSEIEVKRLAVELEILRQNVAKRVVERYLAVLATSASLDHIAAERKAVEQQLELSAGQYAVGLIRQSDHREAEARALGARTREIELKSEMADGLLALVEILGRLPESLAKVSDNIPLVRPEPPDPKAWVELAYKQNLKILADRYSIDGAQKEVQAQRAGHLPTVEFEANVGRRDTKGTLFGGGSDVETQELKLTLNIPIFAGGAVLARTKAAVERHSSAMVRLVLTHRQVERETRVAFNNVMNAISRVESFAKLIEANQSVLEALETGYETGAIPIIHVLDAQRNLFFSRREHALARHEYIANLLGLKRAAGTLNDEDIREISNLMFSKDESVPLNANLSSTYMASDVR
jgi:outer membrane protein